MGTKINALPPVITPVGADELPISQATGLTGRTTYKATLDQLKGYMGSGTGSVTNVGVNSTDGSIGVFGSPIVAAGTISLTISSVGLDKLDDGGATGGEVLTYNASTGEWTPGFGGSSGIIPNILVGNGGTTYTLTNYTNDTESNYLVFVGGVAQRPVTDFNISGSSIIFGSTIPSGVQILVYSVINIATLNLDATPIGTVSWFAASAAPTSYLECSGGVVAISEYLDLYNVIGKKFNTGGEGASNFRLPDLRGEFIRGWDHGRNVNTGRVFGSNESDAFKSHNHLIASNVTGNSYPLSSNYLAVTENLASGLLLNENFEYQLRGTSDVPDSYVTSNAGGVETRPRNVALLPCIKAQKTVTGNVNTLNFIEKPAGPTNGQVLTYNGSTSTWVASAATVASSNITSGTAVTLTNQTSVDFTGIPSTAKKITIMFDGVSTTANSSSCLIQIGSGSIDSTGYTSRIYGVTTNTNTSTTGVIVTDAASTAVFGSIEIFLLSPNIWIFTGQTLETGGGAIYRFVGRKSLLGSLDRLRLTTTIGTDQFDAGIVNIMWE